MFGRQSSREFLQGVLAGEREFMRELALRMERSERAMVAEFIDARNALTERMDRSERRIVAEILESRRASSEANTEISATLTAIRDELAEGRAEQRAARQALFRILDRLDRLDPGDAPA